MEHLGELAEARSGTFLASTFFREACWLGVLESLGVLSGFKVFSGFGVLSGFEVLKGFGVVSCLRLFVAFGVLRGLGVQSSFGVAAGLTALTDLGVANLGVVSVAGLIAVTLGVVGTGRGIGRDIGLGEAEVLGEVSLGKFGEEERDTGFNKVGILVGTFREGTFGEAGGVMVGLLGAGIFGRFRLETAADVTIPGLII